MLRITDSEQTISYCYCVSHTHICNLVHCVFSTKRRDDLIPDPPRLWQYVGGIARQKNVLLLAAGGTANHLHLLLSLPPTVRLSKTIQEIKGNTSRWVNGLAPPFAWQQGYGAFSVSQSQRKAVIDYIDGQPEHHVKWTFEQEYIALVKKSGISYDGRFLFG